MTFKRAIRRAERSGGELTKDEIGQLAERFDVKRSAVRQQAEQNAYKPFSNLVVPPGVQTSDFSTPSYSSSVSAPTTSSATLPDTTTSSANNIYDFMPSGYADTFNALAAQDLAKQRIITSGNIDIQKIISAGYSDVARINRSSNLFSSIMGAFNF